MDTYDDTGAAQQALKTEFARDQWAAEDPTQNLKAERAVLGSVMIDSSADVEQSAIMWAKIEKELEVSDFRSPAHQQIYLAMQQAVSEALPIDIITISTILKDRQQFEKIGGAVTMLELSNETPTAIHLPHYIGLVKRATQLRRWDKASERLRQTIWQGAKVDQVRGLIEEMLQGPEGEQQETQVYHISEVIAGEMEALESRRNGPMTGLTGISTPIDDLDYYTAGFQPSDLILLAARPSMGKSALAQQMAVFAAEKHQQPVLLYSLEMSREQMVIRMLCSEAQVEGNRFRKGMLTEDEWYRIREAADRLCDLSLYICDSTGITVREMLLQARKLKDKQGLCLVLVDYLQIVRSSGRSSGNRVQEVGQIATDLKDMARSLYVPVVALAQLSRNVENRPDKRPMLSDLRESGNLEAAADLVLMLHREAYYKGKSDVHIDGPEEDVETAEIIIAKHRNGPTGTVQAVFVPKFAHFAPLDDRYQGSAPAAPPLEVGWND